MQRPSERVSEAVMTDQEYHWLSLHVSILDLVYLLLSAPIET